MRHRFRALRHRQNMRRAGLNPDGTKIRAKSHGRRKDNEAIPVPVEVPKTWPEKAMEAVRHPIRTLFRRRV